MRIAPAPVPTRLSGPCGSGPRRSGMAGAERAGGERGEQPTSPHPAPSPGQAQQERWRCEVDWRCYATDPDTRERTELMSSGTAWRQRTPAECGCARKARSKALEAQGDDCRTGYPHYEASPAAPAVLERPAGDPCGTVASVRAGLRRATSRMVSESQAGHLRRRSGFFRHQKET